MKNPFKHLMKVDKKALQVEVILEKGFTYTVHTSVEPPKFHYQDQKCDLCKKF